MPAHAGIHDFAAKHEKSGRKQAVTFLKKSNQKTSDSPRLSSATILRLAWTPFIRRSSHQNDQLNYAK